MPIGIYWGNHHYKKVTFNLIVGNITIEEGAWIGAQCVVCPGVKVGSHAVLTVNSVATARLEPWVFIKEIQRLRLRIGLLRGNCCLFLIRFFNYSYGINFIHTVMNTKLP